MKHTQSNIRQGFVCDGEFKHNKKFNHSRTYSSELTAVLKQNFTPALSPATRNNRRFENSPTKPTVLTHEKPESQVKFCPKR